MVPFSSIAAIAFVGLGLSSTGNVPSVSRIHVKKSAHVMELFDGDALVATYRVSLGPGGLGRKGREGDRVTPVGHYRVFRRGSSLLRSIFLWLDYPNAEDLVHFRELRTAGKIDKASTVGGDVGIHGGSDEPKNKGTDWTLGCLGVTDEEILQIARMVDDGTPIDIED